MHILNINVLRKNPCYHKIVTRANNIYVLLAVVFIVRMICLFFLGRLLEPEHWHNWIWENDTQSYLNYIINANKNFDSLPARLPGYPLFILITRSLFSVDFLGTILLQQIIALLSGWGMYRITRQYCGNYSLYAALILLFEPASLIYSFSIMPESILECLLLIATMIMLNALSQSPGKKLLSIIGASFILCLGVFFKPIVLYAFVIYAAFILVYFTDIFWKRIIYAVIFVFIFQLPLQIYRQFIFDRFGVYALCRQEFSEKAARSTDIKFLAVNGKIMSKDSLHNEILNTLIASGYDTTHPNYVLYAHVTDSITRSNLKNYPYATAYYSFSESYMFFQPGTKMVLHFLNLPNTHILSHTATFEEKVSHLKGRMLTITDLSVLLFSILYSVIILVPFVISLFNKTIRKQYSPFIYLAVMWFLYTAVACGRISQFRYRTTFVWTFTLLIGIVISHIKTNGIKSIFHIHTQTM